jgi:hypothetical protein
MVRILAAVLALLLATATPVLADQGKGKGNDKAGNPNSEDTTSAVVEGIVGGVVGAVLNDDEKKTIRQYFDSHPEAGGKVKPLPPGIRKKLARGGTLPPGIAKQALPDGLHRQLPPRTGQDYEVIGTDVVLIDTATKVIVDVLKDVLRGG